MTNRFQDVDSISTLVFQTVGAASMCWEGGPGDLVFDTDEARRVAEDCLGRLADLLKQAVEKPWLTEES